MRLKFLPDKFEVVDAYISFYPWQLDVMYDRIDMAGWPTRDRSAPEEEC